MSEFHPQILSGLPHRQGIHHGDSGSKLLRYHDHVRRLVTIGGVGVCAIVVCLVDCC